MKKTILGGLLLVSGVLFTATVSADDKQVITQGSTQIPIYGTLGADNTDPGENIPEGSNAWINVTVPETTVFGTLKKDAGSAVVSPKYTIKNFSGRGVSVTYADLKKTTTEEEKPGLELLFSIESSSGSQVENKFFTMISDDKLMTSKLLIANLNPVTSSGKGDGGELSYRYAGSVRDLLTKTISTNYEMTLQFKALPK